jgi:hypothetical protein
VQTYKIYVSKGRDRVNEIRSELFVFPEILEVFVTGRPDSLVVVCRGRPRPAEWLRALRLARYDVAHRRHSPTPAAKCDRTTVVAQLRREPPSAPTMPRSRRSAVGLCCSVQLSVQLVRPGFFEVAVVAPPDGTS